MKFSEFRSAQDLNLVGEFVRDEATEQIVREIITDVSSRGYAALLDSARKYDASGLSSIEVSQEEIETAKVDDSTLESLRVAIERIKEFHLRQLEAITAGFDSHWEWSNAGVGQRLVRLQKAGVYVPGGRAVYPSSVIMNAVPAIVAGVPEVVVATPAQPDGTLAPAVLVALREVGVTKAIKVGGAAAIAGLALVENVDKIVGPGNKFVNEAKKQLWGRCGFDGYAGSSEVCVMVDAFSDARFAAVDLLTQIEHAPDNRAFLISTSKSKLEEIFTECEKLMPMAKDETSIRQAYDQSSAFLVDHIDRAIELANLLAPEHLTLAIQNPEQFASQIRTAGCVLMGEWTPESAGDYILGPSHTLPTARAGRWQSPVNVMDFLKFQSVSHLTREQLQPLIPHIENIAKVEGFSMHGLGATERRTETDHIGETRGC